MQAEAVAMPTRCLCGHPKQRHDVPGFNGECIADGCRCAVYQPRQPVTVPQRQPVPHTLEQIIGAAKTVGSKRARLTAERIEHLADELRHLLAADRAKARADVKAREIANLPKAAQPSGVVKRELTVEYGEFPCPEEGCDFTARTKSGIGPHRRYVHGFRRTPPTEATS